MMIKDLEVARDLSSEEQSAVQGGAVSLANLGLAESGGLTQLVGQTGIGNAAVAVNLENQLINQINVAPVVNVAPTVVLPGVTTNVLNFG
jgi:hypothetical protein